MKLSTPFYIGLGASGAVAQRSFIGYPPPGYKISPGQKLTVQVIRPNSIQGSTEVGIVIGLLSCQSDPCPPPSAQIGNIVFNGDFNPQLHEQPGRPYQNFTVTVPASLSSDLKKAQLAIARFHLIGAGPSPVLELNNVTLTTP